jgi:hypothetical protein
MIQLVCSTDLALKLGAVIPGTLRQQRELQTSPDHLIVRDRRLPYHPLFWRWTLPRTERAAERDQTRADIITSRSTF